ncbi:hypothetical protein D3C75_484620 [compost metagenome]
MRVDNHLGDIMQFDNMSNRPVSGDTQRNHYAIVLNIPDNSTAVSLGVIFAGREQAWVDKPRFMEVSDSTPTTNLEYTRGLLDESVNLSFEE